MKKITVALILAFAAATVQASVLGFLVSSRPAQSVTARVGWACTYNVNGQYVEVFLPNVSPPNMYFN